MRQMEAEGLGISMCEISADWTAAEVFLR